VQLTSSLVVLLSTWVLPVGARQGGIRVRDCDQFQGGPPNAALHQGWTVQAVIVWEMSHAVDGKLGY
jgi:hypothetical protein